MPSKSKSQQRYMGMVHACKKSDYKDCASKEVEDTARGMKAKDAKDFASTKHKGLPDKKEKNEMKDLIKQMVREAMDSEERAFDDTHAPLEGQELLDALASDISDMYKDINGIRPRWIKFSEMSLEELEVLHDQTERMHSDWWNEERVQQDLDDMADEDDAIAAADAEEEMMRTPEDGEEFPKQTGMRRRMSENRMRRDTANKLYNLLIMEQEYGIITPQELAELRASINKVLGVSVGNLMEILSSSDPAWKQNSRDFDAQQIMDLIDKALTSDSADRLGVTQDMINRIRKGVYRVLLNDPQFAQDNAYRK
jgi:hypothetical protein